MKSDCMKCDGTGSVCDTCGESEAACLCEANSNGDVMPSFSDCDDCNGEGFFESE